MERVLCRACNISSVWSCRPRSLVQYIGQILTAFLFKGLLMTMSIAGKLKVAVFASILWALCTGPAMMQPQLERAGARKKRDTQCD